ATVASFTAGAVGASPIDYRWQRAGTNLLDGGKLSGTATVSLTVSNIQAVEMGGYSLVASNAYGSVTSSNALLSLWPLVGWGRNDYGEANIPAGLSNVTTVANGLYHSLGLKADGTLVAWGAGTLNTGVSPQQGQPALWAGDRSGRAEQRHRPGSGRLSQLSLEVRRDSDGLGSGHDQQRLHTGLWAIDHSGWADQCHRPGSRELSQLGFDFRWDCDGLGRGHNQYGLHPRPWASPGSGRLEQRRDDGGGGLP